MAEEERDAELLGAEFVALDYDPNSEIARHLKRVDRELKRRRMRLTSTHIGMAESITYDGFAIHFKFKPEHKNISEILAQKKFAELLGEIFTQLCDMEPILLFET